MYENTWQRWHVAPSLSCVYIHSFSSDWERRQTVKIFWLNFRVFACAFPTAISSISGKSFPFPFPYFVYINGILDRNTYDFWTPANASSPSVTFFRLCTEYRLYRPQMLFINLLLYFAGGCSRSVIMNTTNVKQNLKRKAMLIFFPVKTQLLMTVLIFYKIMYFN